MEAHRRLWRAGTFCLCLALAGTRSLVLAAVAATGGDGNLPGLTYTNCRFPEIPWSIQVVKLARTNAAFEIHSLHAGSRALGMSTLREQVASLDPHLGKPVAAINGDFYLRDKTYAGGPRGAQVVNGELFSGPRGGAGFWVDLLGTPHLAEVTPHFEVTWPDGRIAPFGLNADRGTNGLELYTPAIGGSTHTTGGTEFVLEPTGAGHWLPLRVGRGLQARVKEVRTGGDSPVGAGQMVLSLSPALASRFSGVSTGAVLGISLETTPPLRGVLTAIGGGPVLIGNGKARKIVASAADAYESSSMLERHPRSALGWSKESFYLVQVDGRQRDLSVGMTLEELTDFMLKLGCDEALNLDGGGSSTLWFDGEVRNNPCDGYERPLANCLVIVRKPVKTAAPATKP